MSVFAERVIVAGVLIVVTLVVAHIVDRALVRRLRLTPQALTRYRVLRRSVVASIVFVGVVGALMVIPGVRAVAGTILASSAVIALVVGYAAQPTLANLIAGILIAFAQPLRLGDRVEAAGAVGTVEDIGLTYTLIRSPDGSRFYLPNAKLASDTIKNATLGSSAHLVRVSLTVSPSLDLGWVMKMLVDEALAAPGTLPERHPVAALTRVDVSGLEVTVDAWARTAGQADRAAIAIRHAAHERLREREAA